MDPVTWIAIIAFILAVVAAVVSIALRPVPIPPPAAGLSDFQVPTAEAGRPIPVIFGTVSVKGPNVVWYGDLFVEPIPVPERDSSDS